MSACLSAPTRRSLTILGVIAAFAAVVMPWPDDPASAETGFAPPPERVVAYTILNARSIPARLTDRPGNPERGRQLFFDRQRTGCSGCHGSPGGPGAEATPDSEDAPDLAGLARRMEIGTARLWLVAPAVLAPETEMPAFYAIAQRTDPNDPRYGEPRLSAEEIEDILAYLYANASAVGD